MSGAAVMPTSGATAFGLEPGTLQALRAFFDAAQGVQRVWVFGSRARDDWRPRSDIDLAVDAPGWSAQDFLRFKERMKDLPIVYPLDVVHWQGVSTPEFVAQIERDRKLLWEPRRGAEGEITGISLVVLEVTAQRAAEAALKRLDQTLSSVEPLYLRTAQAERLRAERIRGNKA